MSKKVPKHLKFSQLLVWNLIWWAIKHFLLFKKHWDTQHRQAGSVIIYSQFLNIERKKTHLNFLLASKEGKRRKKYHNRYQDIRFIGSLWEQISFSSHKKNKRITNPYESGRKEIIKTSISKTLILLRNVSGVQLICTV